MDKRDIIIACMGNLTAQSTAKVAGTRVHNVYNVWRKIGKVERYSKIRKLNENGVW